jgi:peptidoglycan/LPS O-acetylase OafA/YrhL
MDEISLRQTNITSVNAKGRMRSYDMLRGIAISGVVIFHTFIIFDPHIKIISAVAGLGVYGVQLFFIVSSLTMCLMWQRRSGEDQPILKFYIRRFFRIAPPFWLAMIGYLFLNGTGSSPSSPDGIGLRHIAVTSIFLHGFWPDTINNVVPGGWSIAVEMTFYTVFPFLVAWNASAVVLAVAAFAVYLANVFVVSPLLAAIFSGQPAYVLNEFLYFEFFNQAPIFLLGMALFRIVGRDEQRLIFVTFIFFWLAVAFSLKGFLSIHSSPFFWLTVSTLVLFSWLCLSQNITLSPLPELGKISYSIYLTHFAVIELVEFLFRSLSIEMHSLWSFLGALTVIGILCCSIATFMRVTLEAWSSAIGEWLISRLPPSIRITAYFP